MNFMLTRAASLLSLRLKFHARWFSFEDGYLPGGIYKN